MSAFKDALARLASGVAIVSCWDGARPRGLLVSSIIGLSVEPPRFLFCVRKEAGCHDALLASRGCGVAILGREDQDEALRFSSSALADQRFKDARWDLEAKLAPRLRDCLTSAACTIEDAIDAGGHTILVVAARECVSRTGTALVAYERALHGLTAEA